MFAFALWDTKRETLHLGRDRLGIKPLFVARTADGFVFGSEIKCLLASEMVSTEMDWQALDELITYNFIPGPRSIYRNIEKVAPGTVISISAKGIVATKKYWSVPDVGYGKYSEREWEERIEARLRDAVQSHLVSDVPIGAFLSGGVDSGLMVGMMAQAMDRPVETFTVGFADAGSAFIDERVYARKIAQRYGLNHHEIHVEPKVTDILGDIVEAFDEPFADDSVVPSYYVSKIAVAKVKVALTGLGGDELFGGYRRYLGLKIGDAYSRVPAFLRTHVVDQIIRRMPEPKSADDIVDHLKRFSRASSKPGDRRYQDSMTTLPSDERRSLYTTEAARHMSFDATERVITGPFTRCAFGNNVDRALKTDLQIYLPDDILTLTDRLSMWHSLELRVPYLDHRLIEEAAALPVTMKVRGVKLKHLLKNIALKWLPEDVVTHKKQGFEAPMGRWLKGPLRELLEDTLAESTLRRNGIFDVAQVRRIKDEHMSGQRKHSKILFSLLMFSLWNQKRDAVAPATTRSAVG
jgi:asparagine synthase (glutamine-hydrolysing)